MTLRAIPVTPMSRECHVTFGKSAATRGARSHVKRSQRYRLAGTVCRLRYAIHTKAKLVCEDFRGFLTAPSESRGYLVALAMRAAIRSLKR